MFNKMKLSEHASFFKKKLGLKSKKDKKTTSNVFTEYNIGSIWLRGGHSFLVGVVDGRRRKILLKHLRKCIGDMAMM